MWRVRIFQKIRFNVGWLFLKHAVLKPNLCDYNDAYNDAMTLLS